MLYGYLSKQYFAVFWTFVVGYVLNLAYIGVFYRYTNEKPKAHRIFLLFGLFAAMTNTYAFLGGFGLTGQTRHATGHVLGYAAILTTSMYYTSPLERVGLVLKHRSAAYLNYQMILAGVINNVVWIVYTTLAEAWLIFAPNCFCCFMGCVQLALYVVYHPSTHPLVIPSDEDAVAVDALECGSCVDKAEQKKSRDVGFALVASPLETRLCQPKSLE